MSVVVVGLSHRTAPVGTLERAVVATDALPGVLAAPAVPDSQVRELVVLSTCNRVEAYAEVGTFHAGVGELTAQLAAQAGLGVDEVAPHLFVHYEDAAIAHLFEVACGLDSLVVGEAQILGQVRAALGAARDAGRVGRSLDTLFQQALRVGKRAHAETGIDSAGSVVVDAALDSAGRSLGGLAGRRALVVGAGAMSGLVVARLARAGVAQVVVANRGEDRARRLAASVGEPATGRAVALDRLAEELTQADLVVSCTGATGLVVTAAMVAPRPAGRPLVAVDLALPHDVDPALAETAGVQVVDLETLTAALAGSGTSVDVAAVEGIVAEEVVHFLDTRRADRVAPTVAALRQRAEEIVVAELDRLAHRVPDLDPAAATELERTVRRVVDKLLHQPTVRVKELAGTGPDGLRYAEALHALFDLDPARYREVVTADVAGDAARAPGLPPTSAPPAPPPGSGAR